MLINAQVNYNAPESVVYDSQNNRYLISNAGNGNIIARASNGNLSYFNQGGLSSLRGITIYNNKLYAADDEGVLVYDLANGQKTAIISIRAINTLKEVDFIICEEFKDANRILNHLQIKQELVSLNEHNENESSQEILQKIKEGSSAALISDCGTSPFSDPGNLLMQMCIAANIDVLPIPGASSLLPALVGSGFNLDKFYYAGWLSPKSDLRRKELLRLKSIRELIVIMETPYWLKAILTDISKIFGSSTKIVVAFDLTLPTEKFYRGTVSEILKIITEKNLKGEFVLIIDNK